MRESIIKEVKNILITKDNYTIEEVDLLLLGMYDRVRKINNQEIKLISEILKKVLELREITEIEKNVRNLKEEGRKWKIYYLTYFV